MASFKSFLIVVLVKGFGSLPLPVIYGLAWCVSQVVERVDCRMRKTVYANLNACFPAYSEAEIKKLAEDSILETSKSAVEMLYLWQCSRRQIDKRVIEVKGHDAFVKAKGAGKGVLLLGPHLGAWEMVNLYFSPMTAMYDPPKQTGLEKVMKDARERFGSTLVPADVSGVKGLFKALLKGKVVGVLPDQDPDFDVGGDFAPFFNVPALTMSLPVRLAQKKQVPTFYAFTERKKGGKFVIHFIPVDKDFYHKDEKIALTAMNKGLEKCIAICPSQYQWAYKRFKRRPKDGSDFYA